MSRRKKRVKTITIPCPECKEGIILVHRQRTVWELKELRFRFSRVETGGALFLRNLSPDIVSEFPSESSMETYFLSCSHCNEFAEEAEELDHLVHLLPTVEDFHKERSNKKEENRVKKLTFKRQLRTIEDIEKLLPEGELK